MGHKKKLLQTFLSTSSFITLTITVHVQGLSVQVSFAGLNYINGDGNWYPPQITPLKTVVGKPLYCLEGANCSPGWSPCNSLAKNPPLFESTWHCFLAPPSRIPEGGAPEIDLGGWENPTWWSMMIKKKHQWFFKVCRGENFTEWKNIQKTS